MRRWLIILFCFCLVSASVDVDSYEVVDAYVFSDKISGEVNLTIIDEDYSGEIIFSNGGRIGLANFLIDNAVDFYCFPEDCSTGYSYAAGALSKNISISSSEAAYVGFLVEGDDILLDSVSFKVYSDFGKGIERPLTIEFFEGEDWVFSSFSEDLLPKNWGCFDSEFKTLGPEIRGSFYCEMISLGSSSVFRVGADVDEGEGEGELDMAVYPESGFGGSWECSFDPSVEDGCFVRADAGEVFSEGKYQVCVSSESVTPYIIYEDIVGENCGFPYDDGPANSRKDYAIFAQSVKYADAGSIGEIDFSDKIEAANEIIQNRYGGNCSKGCVLPLKISGVPQNFNIYDADLVYMDGSEWRSDDVIYDLEMIPARVDFNGTLDLGLLGISVLKEGIYFARLSGEDIFNKDIKLLPAPIVSSVSPLDPPAAVPVVFHASVDFEGNESLSYEWDFGDGSANIQTTEPDVSYTYTNISNYTLSLRVSAGGNLTSRKSFNVEVISPELAVINGLESRKEALAGAREDISDLSVWYEKDLIKILEVDYFEGELSRLEKMHNNSFVPEDFMDVALELYALNIPVVVGSNDFESPFLMTELGDIDIGPVATISGSGGDGDNDFYANAIFMWQDENVDAVMKLKNIFVTYLDGEDRDVLSSYYFDVTSKWDRESYFVIGKPFGELYFNGNSGVRKADNSAVIVLEAGEKKSFEFYYNDHSRGEFFVSPALGSLVIEEDIAEDCNFNSVCEKDMGETTENCRSDCKPIAKAFIIFVITLCLLLIAYTILQIWYKKHYENYLFGKGPELFNLLMYISNARASDVEDKKIIADLKSRGWSSEKVNYGIRKSIGKNIGMIEIIPIERVSAWLRDMKARRAIKKARAADKKAGGNGKKEENNVARVPRQDGFNRPPARGGNRPPARGGNRPPARGGNRPPVRGGNRPPMRGGNRPPARGGNRPPARGGKFQPGRRR
jgi:PKD repeat protein